MKIVHLVVSLAIVGCTSIAWFVLGAAISQRTNESSAVMQSEVAGIWGPSLEQQHPSAYFETPNVPGGRAVVGPSSSMVDVRLNYEPKRRGLLWHRTYEVTVSGNYTFSNPTRIPQTFYVSFPLPGETAGLHHFRFQIEGEEGAGEAMPGAGGNVMRAVVVPASGEVALRVGYTTRGTGMWAYRFSDNRRVSGFRLNMRTDFHQIDYPPGTGSPSSRSSDREGWDLAWDYPDVLAAPSIGMDMPKRLNAGPVAARIVFFAPVSLLLFVAVVLLVGTLRGAILHPMHVFFVSAGFFAFHLLFAYLVDLLPLYPSFGIATVVSVLLVCGYLAAVGGRKLLAIALPAQLAYLILFSASFFFDQLTGITLTVCGVATLALMMLMTAKVDWRAAFETRQRPAAA